MATYDDLGHDARLAEGPEEEGEAASDDDNQAYLQDDERQRVAEWIVAVPRPIRGHRWRRRATTARRRHAPAPFSLSLSLSREFDRTPLEQSATPLRGSSQFAICIGVHIIKFN